MNIPRPGTTCFNWLYNEDARLVMCNLQLLPPFFPIVFSMGLLPSCWMNCVLISISSQTMLLEQFIRYQAQMLSQLILMITRGVNFFLSFCTGVKNSDKTNLESQRNRTYGISLSWLQNNGFTWLRSLWSWHLELGISTLRQVLHTCSESR